MHKTLPVIFILQYDLKCLIPYLYIFLIYIHVSHILYINVYTSPKPEVIVLTFFLKSMSSRLRQNIFRRRCFFNLSVKLVGIYHWMMVPCWKQRRVRYFSGHWMSCMNSYIWTFRNVHIYFGPWAFLKSWGCSYDLIELWGENWHQIPLLHFCAFISCLLYFCCCCCCCLPQCCCKFAHSSTL